MLHEQATLAHQEPEEKPIEIEAVARESVEATTSKEPEAPVQTEKGEAKKPASETLEPLTVRLHRHAGLYRDKSYAPELKNVLLLTAANSGYVEMLTNWECIAQRLGLDWMVIAIDSDLQHRLGERSFTATGQEWGKAEGFFSKGGFQLIACNKIRTVAEVLRTTNLDIVFSDGDNVFKSDPFLPSLTLGSMIRSGKYEYIYGRKIEPGNQKIQNFKPEIWHQEPNKGNTGFYYVAGGRKQTIVQNVFDKGVKWCDSRPHMDDQENFWDALFDSRRKKRTAKDYVACFRHCDNNATCAGLEESQIFNYCDMSPWEYILGCFTPASALEEPRMVSYHATHVVGWEFKRKKLQQVKLWAYCNESEIIGSKKIAAEEKPIEIEAVARESVEATTSKEPEAPVQTEKGEAKKPASETLEPLTVRLHRHAGLYRDKSYAPELKNVLLLTAANSGYVEMLTNWECIAQRLGLDWMVIAIDSDLQHRLGERSFTATGQEWGKAEGFFSKGGFQLIACNKIRTVAEVLRTTNLDIVFSDGDNVFKSDPFLPSLTLGSMIRSGKYEYIYGRKIEPGNQKIQNFKPEIWHQEPNKGNTGFYYVAGGRKQTIVQNVFDKGVKWCDSRPHMDDQENFWDALFDSRRKKRTAKDYVACFRHCDNYATCAGLEESQIFNYCDMSPWEYILGCFTPASALEEPRMVSYHATHVVGWEFKRKKLQQVKLWAYCNESEIIGSKKIAAEEKPIEIEAVARESVEATTSKEPEAPVQTEKGEAKKPASETLEPLTVRLHRHAGLYRDKSYAPELKNVLLLTAANSGYVEMLTNWECIAQRLGLDWMVIAIDSDLQHRLGERSFTATGQEWGKAEGFFSKGGFQLIACNKIRTVAEVLRTTNLDIVFSDGDNVFKSDPFLPSLTLGSMIRSGKYEYIYGRKIEPGNQKIQNFKPEIWHQEPNKGNTGFYYVAGGRKQTIVQNVFDKGVKWCDSRPHMDDQENFWDALFDSRRKKRTAKDYVACFRHCDNNATCAGLEESQIFNYCDMSPWEYILGCFTPASALEEPRMVSYHATHVVGWESKRKKLQKVKLWAYCNESEIVGSVPESESKSKS